MPLTEKDSEDLLGLISGLGPPESQARARQLAGSNPEAAEYLRQMQTIARALSPGEYEEKPLSPREVDMITQTIFQRVARRRYRFPSWALLLSTAAAVAVIVVSAKWILMSPRAPGGAGALAIAVFVPEEGHLTAEQAVSKPRQDYSSGQIIQTAKEWAVVSFVNGNRAVLGSGTELAMENSRRIDLIRGDAFLFAHTDVAVEARDVLLELKKAEVSIRIRAGQSECAVYEGQAIAAVEGRAYHISAGNRGLWTETEKQMIIQPIVTPRPGWVTRALQLVDGQ